MDIQKMLPFGALHITDRTLTELIYIVVSEVEGVAKTISPLSETVYKAVGKNRGEKGIFLQYDEKGLIIEVKVALFHNVSILGTCQSIQEHVKKEVEFITGLQVKAVHIKVEQIIKAYPS